MNDTIMVSIVMITYNHESYIKEAIEGVLMQETNFNYELIVSDDCSPDVTEKVIREVIDSHAKGNKIKYFRHEKNIGMQNNSSFALHKCSGKYIALCEGDDFWTDVNKLQKQVDFLEKNNDYSICFHAVDVKYENNLKPFLKDINKNTPDTTTIFDLLQNNYLHTPSVIFRRTDDYPEWLISAYPGDWPLHIINATYGKIKFLAEKMATYRVHTGGVHSTTGGQIENSFKTFIDIIKELENRSLIKESKFAESIYKKSFVNFYGFNSSQNVNFNRFEKSKLILRDGSKKHKIFFWFPIIFNNSSQKILKSILKIISK